MKMLVLVMMRPDQAVDRLRVLTYRELVDFVMVEVSHERVPPVLMEIEEEL